MEHEKPTVQITKINELPRMYENWNDFYFWWEPWVSATGLPEISIFDYGTGVVTEYIVSWAFVRKTVQKTPNFKPTKYFAFTKIRTLQFLRDFWVARYRYFRLF